MDEKEKENTKSESEDMPKWTEVLLKKLNQL